MEENRIKVVRQFCVSAMMLCLAFLGVFMVQEQTELRAATEETFADGPDALKEDETVPSTEKEDESGSRHGVSEVTGSGWTHIFGMNVPELAKQQGEYCVLIRKENAVFESFSEEMMF